MRFADKVLTFLGSIFLTMVGLVWFLSKVKNDPPMAVAIGAVVGIFIATFIYKKFRG